MPPAPLLALAPMEPELTGECRGHSAAMRGLRRGGDRCGCIVIALLLVSPGSHSPGAAEGSSSRIEQRDHSSWLWEEETMCQTPRVGHGHLHFYPWLLWLSAKLDPFC